MVDWLEIVIEDLCDADVRQYCKWSYMDKITIDDVVQHEVDS